MPPFPAMVSSPAAVLHEDGIWRSSIHQPIYSTVGLDNAAIPQEVRWFGYALGQNVPGAGNAAGAPSTIWHTNMTSAGNLGRPRKFRCYGIRIHMPSIAFTGASATPSLSDPSFGAAAQDSELLEDLMLLAYSCTFSVRVGEKLYADHPLWMAPSNVGFGGLAAVAQDNGSSTTTGQLDICAPHLVGNGLNLRTYPFLIEDQQSFDAVLRCHLPSPPSLNDDRALVCVLDGNLLREVS